MPHARKPKTCNVPTAPPGLSKEDGCGCIEEMGQCLRNLIAQVSSMSESIGILENKVKRLLTQSSEIENQKMFERIELLERVFLYVDWDNLDKNVNTQRQRQSESSEEVDSRDYDGYDWESNMIDPAEPFVLLQDMALNIQMCVSEVGLFSCPVVDLAVDGNEQSLVLQQLSKQATAQSVVASVKRYCFAAEHVGRTGTISELLQLGVLDYGTILESMRHVDVSLYGFNGVRYLTSTSFVKVSNIEHARVTLTDAAEVPALDRGGRRVFGRIDFDDEPFLVVGHACIGGVQTTFEEREGTA